MENLKEKFELSGGMKAVVCILLGVISWPILFILGKVLLGLVFLEVSTALLVIWGIIVTLGLGFAVGLYIDEEL